MNKSDFFQMRASGHWKQHRLFRLQRLMRMRSAAKMIEVLVDEKLASLERSKKTEAIPAVVSE